MNINFFREFPHTWVIDMLEKNEFEVLDVALFPINWGSKALHSQLDVCDKYLNEVPLSSFMTIPEDSYRIQLELRHQVKALRNYINSPDLKKMGICFGFDWVVVAKLKEN